MHTRLQQEWQALWRILTNPAFEVIAAIVLVLLAAWVVIGTEAFQGATTHLPDLFGHK